VTSGRALVVLALVAAAGPAIAHEVLHEVQRGRAVAVRAWFPDGESLAYVQAEVFSPADATVPYWKGRTDRSGWLAFVPDVPGSWRVRIVDATGHGLDTVVEVAPAAGLPAAPVATSGSGTGPGASTLPLALRPVAGVALIAAIFGFLYLRGRRKNR
jgi:nickel transport protein